MGRASLAVAVAALVLALTGAALGLPGRGSVDQNDLSKRAKRSLSDPRAFALVTGPGEVRSARAISDGDVTVNNTAFCISGVGFKPRHVQVTARTASVFPKAILRDQTACSGGTAVFFDGDLNYEEEFFIALFR